MEKIIIYSGLAGLATCLGGLLVIWVRNPGERFLASTLGLAAGIMFGVTILDLLPSAWIFGTPTKFFAGLGSGILFMRLLDAILTQTTPRLPRTRDPIHFLHMGYLVAIGIALHDLPEGMAIAVGYEATEELGLIIALAIALHNIPEGMAIALPLKIGGAKAKTIIFIALLASFCTPLGTLAGMVLISFSRHFISFLLAAAAGAMLYIVFAELGPESKRRHPNFAKLGAVLGMLLIGLLSLPV
ncbi:ZIP family metal transporter [Dehalobacterium formicoaceticum]|uniref:ZIP family metal transporter n=1 Tax=Dehalobacterium formicoaceticum TaxID=51515 RepID=A0ABT1Y5N9_9FIRM|nr:ZIP family metal transporter [Dehalobacterium formicoaceticum]MCR6545440.1 ZIP family metal transporter [Dehalobacterium formicoaceticum]